MSSNSPERADSARRETKAREYRRIALLIGGQDGDRDASGSLLYEAAKQCISAVASQQGMNPGPTGSKIRFLRNLASSVGAMPNLLDNWQAASALHVNADRLHLSEPEFDKAWTDAQAFINQMLQIYSRLG